MIGDKVLRNHYTLLYITIYKISIELPVTLLLFGDILNQEPAIYCNIMKNFIFKNSLIN